MKNIKRILTAFASLLLLLTTASCSDDTTRTNEIYNDVFDSADYFSETIKFFNYTSQGEYLDAVDFFYDKISGNYSREKDVYRICENCYEAISTGYLNGKIDGGTAKTEVEKIKQVVDGIGFYFDESYDAEYERVKTSKTNYSLGYSAFESQNYEMAMYYFMLVAEDDVNYKYAQEYFEKAKTEYKNQTILLITEDVANENYTVVLSKLAEIKKLFPDDVEIQALIDEYSSSYVSKTVAEANSVFKTPSTDWENSYNIIKKAQQILPDNKKLQEKADYYLSFKPVSLFDMHILNKTSHYRLDSVTDNMGNTYHNCMSYSHTGNSKDWQTGADITSPMSAIYILDRKYNKLNFTLAVEEGDSSQWFYMAIDIYGDGNLIYTADDLKQNTKPRTEEIDVTGISELKVKIRFNGGNGYYRDGRELIFADPILSKTVA